MTFLIVVSITKFDYLATTIIKRKTIIVDSYTLFVINRHVLVKLIQQQY